MYAKKIRFFIKKLFKHRAIHLLVADDIKGFADGGVFGQGDLVILLHLPNIPGNQSLDLELDVLLGPLVLFFVPFHFFLGGHGFDGLNHGGVHFEKLVVLAEIGVIRY